MKEESLDPENWSEFKELAEHRASDMVSYLGPSTEGPSRTQSRAAHGES